MGYDMRSDENIIQLYTTIVESCSIEFVFLDGNKGPCSQGGYDGY